MTRNRAWCFTINNYTFEEMDACINLPVEYKVFGFEVGKKGTPHIQGYLYHNDRISMKQLKKSIPRAHLEKAKGSPQQNYDYCTKDGEFYEFGNLPVKGKRTDLDKVIEMVYQGATYEEICAKYPKQACFYSRRIQDFIEQVTPKKTAKFYVMKTTANKHEDIQIIHEYFGTLKDPAVVFDRLENIAAYGNDYDNVIFYPEDYKSEHAMVSFRIFH